MSRFRARTVRPIEHKMDRWEDLALIALRWIAGEVADDTARYYANRTRLVHPLGQPGETNPCTWLREEVFKRLDPPRVVPRPGVDVEAMTADNRDQIERLALMVLDRVRAASAVAEAQRKAF
jgi:hypothetical protein